MEQMTLEEFAANVGHQLIARGELSPSLFLLAGKSPKPEMYMLVLMDVPETSQARRGQMMLMGMMAKDRVRLGEFKPIHTVFHATEAWTAKLTPEEWEAHQASGQQISDRADRIECLVVQRLDMKTREVTLLTFEMKRAASGELIELVPMFEGDTRNPVTIQRSLIEGFLVGYQSK